MNNNNRTRMVSQAARNAARTPHHHTFGDRINGRDVCLTCPYRAPRGRMISAFLPDSTIENSTNTILRQAANIINNAPIADEYTNPQKMTVPQLIEIVRRNHPHLKGVSKMRKPELISVLVGK